MGLIEGDWNREKLFVFGCIVWCRVAKLQFCASEVVVNEKLSGGAELRKDEFGRNSALIWAA